MKIFAAVAILFAALADPAASAVASDCIFAPEFKDMSEIVLRCDVFNSETVAIASFSFHAVISQQDRVVPWVDKDRGTMIPGGIEPGETIKTNLYLGGRIPDRADLSRLVIAVTITKAVDVNGKPIP